MLHNIANALLNFLLVSIPEETFLVVMTLIFLKRFDLLDIRMWKQSLKWLAIPVLPVALMINVFKYIIVIPRPMISLITFFLMVGLIIYVVVRNSFSINKKLIFKIIIFTVLSFILIGLIELLYYPLVLSLLHKPISYFNDNYIYNLLLAIPTRVIQLCVVIYAIIKTSNEIQVNLFNTVVKNKFFTNSFISGLVIIVLVIIFFAKLVMVDEILVNLNIIDQLFIIIIVIAIPVAIITWFLIFVNYLLTKEKRIQQTYENLIIEDDVNADVENQ